AVITDPGSLFLVQSNLAVGNWYDGNKLIVSNGATVVAGALYLGAFSPGNFVVLAGGMLNVTNSFHSSTSAVVVGSVVLNSGVFETDFLRLVGNTNSLIQFNGGTLQLRGAYVTNGLMFIAGNGTNAATLKLLDYATCNFPNGLLVSSNATLTGSGS